MSSHKGTSLGPKATKAQVPFLLQFAEDHPDMLVESSVQATLEKKWRLWQQVTDLVKQEGLLPRR